MDLRVFWTVAATWWNQPLFDIPRRQLLNQFAPPGTPAAITTITKAAHGAWWLKGALLPVGAAVRQLARNLLRDPAAAAHVLASQLPHAAPAAAAHVLVNELPHAAPVPWRVAWFIISSVLTLIVPPAVKALRKFHTSRQKPSNISPQQDAVQAYWPSTMLVFDACLLILIIGYVIWRARGWMKASPEAAEKVAFEEEAVVKKAKPTAPKAAAEQMAAAAVETATFEKRSAKPTAPKAAAEQTAAAAVETATFEKRLAKPTAPNAVAERTAAAAEMAVLHENIAAEKKALVEKAAAENAEAAALRRELDAAAKKAAAEREAADKAAAEAKAATEKAADEKAAARKAADEKAAAEKAAAEKAAEATATSERAAAEKADAEKAAAAAAAEAAALRRELEAAAEKSAADKAAAEKAAAKKAADEMAALEVKAAADKAARETNAAAEKAAIEEKAAAEKAAARKATEEKAAAEKAAAERAASEKSVADRASAAAAAEAAALRRELDDSAPNPLPKPDGGACLEIKMEIVPGMAIGINLMDRSAGGGVKIADVSPTSPLAPYVSKGDVLVSINGQACEQGHERASEKLRASTGIIDLVFRAKTGSILGASKRSRIATAFRKGSNVMIFIGGDGQRRDELGTPSKAL